MSHRYIDFANTTFSQLEQLVQACEPVSFGLNDKDVLDETYRKAGKMDSEHFSMPLVPECTDLIKWRIFSRYSSCSQHAPVHCFAS